MKKATTIDTVLPSLLASAFAAVLLTACGGSGPEPDIEMEQPETNGYIAVSADAPKPVDSFGNFNPDIWNHQDWYECNCGRHPDQSPRNTPWKGAN